MQVWLTFLLHSQLFAGTILEMNLYRSFVNLMEAYVYEETTRPEYQFQMDNPDGPLEPGSGVNPSSESVDSGVETTSCETVNPVTASSPSTDNTETDLFLLQSDRLCQESTPQSPVLLSTLPSFASSSPNLHLRNSEEDTTIFTLKGEPELQRTDSKRWKQVYGVLSQQPKSSSLPRQNTSELKRCIRSASFNVRRRFDPSVSIGQVSETERKLTSGGSVEQISQVSGVFDGKELSPGLCYLELVCQKMERYAKEQMKNQALKMETDTIQDNKEQKSDLADAQESQPRLKSEKDIKEILSEPQKQKPSHFRQRSASDTTFSKLHLKKCNFTSRGQRISTNDLREIEEEDNQQMEPIKEESSRNHIIERLKRISLKRGGSVLSTRSQQMQPSEKIPTRQRFSKFFRRSKKVSPI